MELRFITGNENKVKEARNSLKSLGFEVVQDNLSPPEIQANTLEEVARYSAEWVAERSPSPFFLEDAGFFVDSLKGFPGVYSAYVFDTIGYRGILKLMEGEKRRRAIFAAVIAYHNGRGIRLFRGEVVGTVSLMPRGSNGFGYDPIFVPEDSDRTFAEMSTEEKNGISHRGRAIEKLVDFLRERAASG